MEMKQKIRSFLSKYYLESKLDDEESLVNNGYFNSLFAMQFVLFLEKEFDIELDNQDIDINNFSTINQIVKLIEKKQLERDL